MSVASEIIKLQDEYYRETAPIIEAFCKVIPAVELPDIIEKADLESLKQQKIIQRIVSKE